MVRTSDFPAEALEATPLCDPLFTFMIQLLDQAFMRRDTEVRNLICCFVL